jgi:pectate lyase
MKSLYILISIINITKIFAETCSNSAFFQCGGDNWKGQSCCKSGYSCKKYNQWYSMCMPETNESTTTIKKTTTTTKPSSTPTNKEVSKEEEPVNSKLPSAPVGYASMNGGTTGGKGGQTIIVSNQSELQSAIKVSGTKIIKVKGIIQLSSDISINKTSNLSLIGMDNNSGFTGGGFFIKSTNNLIIQNLKFSYCLGSSKDCLGIRRSSKIWVDHCEFYSDLNHGKDYYDGLVDFTYASDYITVSWCYLHDHSKVSLVGHSDNNGSEDRGKLHVTYHHNYFRNVISRIPSIRFGTGHIFNNVYEDIDYTCINSRMGAQVLVEGNVFRKASHPIVTNYESVEDGYVVERNNNFGNTGNSNSITRIGSFNTAPYNYTMDSINSVYNNVINNVGPQ